MPKEGDGPNLVIQDSSTPYPRLLERGLIEQRLTPGGTIMATYEPKGLVETVSFAMSDPSPHKLERRAKLAAGNEKRQIGSGRPRPEIPTQIYEITLFYFTVTVATA